MPTVIPSMGPRKDDIAAMQMWIETRTISKDYLKLVLGDNLETIDTDVLPSMSMLPKAEADIEPNIEYEV
jgi:hypothetical protein